LSENAGSLKLGHYIGLNRIALPKYGINVCKSKFPNSEKKKKKLGVFAKLRKATVSFIFVCQSA
jgi:hypothetical protein